MPGVTGALVAGGLRVVVAVGGGVVLVAVGVLRGPVLGPCVSANQTAPPPAANATTPIPIIAARREKPRSGGAGVLGGIDGKGPVGVWGGEGYIWEVGELGHVFVPDGMFGSEEMTVCPSCPHASTRVPHSPQNNASGGNRLPQFPQYSVCICSAFLRLHSFIAGQLHISYHSCTQM